MSVAALLPATVLVLRAADGLTDPYGSPLAGYLPSVRVRARLEQVSAEEVTTGADVQTADWRAFLPAGTTISGRDRLVYDGVTYEVTGPPRRVVGRRRETYVQVRLRVIQP